MIAPSPDDDLLTAAQVAELAGVSIRTVRRWEAAGHLRGVRFGTRLVRFRAGDVRTLLDQGTP